MGTPLGVVSTTPVAGATGVAILGTDSYVGAGGGIDIVDISNPAQPSVLSTFGAGDLGGASVLALQVYNNELVVLAQQSGGAPSTLLIYSLANPTSPTLLGQTPIAFQASTDDYCLRGSRSRTGMSTRPRTIPASSLRAARFLNSTGKASTSTSQTPSHPTVDGVIYNNPPNPSYYFSNEGTSNFWQLAPASNNVLLIGTTTASGTDVGSDVQGLVMVVDTSNPASPTVLEKLAIPGMGVVTGISVQGSQAFVIGSSETFQTAYSGLGGDVVVATLDLTNPQSPTIVSTQTLSTPSVGMGYVSSLGNGLYVTTSTAGSGGSPQLLLFDASDSSNVTVTPIAVANPVPDYLDDFAVASNQLFVTDGSNLTIYNIGTSQTVPVTATITVPTNNGVGVSPNSFSIAPTNITTGTTSETLTWDLALSGASASQTIQFGETVTGLQPGQSVPVAQAASVAFSSQGASSTLNLPDQYVVGDQIIGLSPTTQTVAPAAPAAYTVNLTNPTAGPVTYTLSVQGIPTEWVDMASSITIPANGSANVPLTLRSNSAAVPGDQGFTVLASGNNGASASVLGDLILQGQPVAPDTQSHGVVVTVVPLQGIAGPGTSAYYVIQVTNTGSAEDVFTLQTSGLPASIATSLGQTTVDVPPGASNFRDVTLTLTPSQGTGAADYPFTISVASTTTSTASDSATGTLQVASRGVVVSLNPPSGASGSGFQLTVTNTGSVSDTYNLTLIGPGALGCEPRHEPGCSRPRRVSDHTDHHRISELRGGGKPRP